MSKQEEEPATGKQLSTIARLSQALGIRSPIEEELMSMAQAGRQIRHLSNQLKLKRFKL